MLDSFEIITTSGVVLWSRSYAPVSTNIINSFIKDVFIEEKVLPGTGFADDVSAAKNPSLTKEQFTLKWASVKDLGLIFVVGIHATLLGDNVGAAADGYFIGCLSVLTSFILD